MKLFSFEEHKQIVYCWSYMQMILLLLEMNASGCILLVVYVDDVITTGDDYKDVHRVRLFCS